MFTRGLATVWQDHFSHEGEGWSLGWQRKKAPKRVHLGPVLFLEKDVSSEILVTQVSFGLLSDMKTNVRMQV